jgi:DNA-directed RNA polymerase specialized sigma24 family protein
MTRLGEAESLHRIEEAARTHGEFQELNGWYDKLDGNRERKERDHEILCPTNEVFTKDYTNGAVIPPPLAMEYWRELMRGEFISTIYDNAEEIWQVFGDWQVGRLIKDISVKQRDVLFRSAVRQCSSEAIAECTNKTKRGVNKLIAATLEHIRPRLAERIKARLDGGLPVTLEKRKFYEWYSAQKETSGLNGREGREANDQSDETPCEQTED